MRQKFFIPLEIGNAKHFRSYSVNMRTIGQVISNGIHNYKQKTKNGPLPVLCLELIDKERDKGSRREQNAKDNARPEQILFRAAASVVAGGKVVSAERAAQRRASLLEQDAARQKDRQYNLYVGERPCKRHSP